MRYVALATDYDGTLASQGSVSAEAVQALRRFRDSGRMLILVTGRELEDLLRIFPETCLFHRVVAENGGLLYCPQTGASKVLGVPPPPEFVRELVRRGVQPLSVGRCIVATVTPHESAVLAAIRELGLELQVIFNKGAVMVLPAGVNKATGLAAALEELRLSLRNVVAIGDAENDHAMLHAAEFGVAVGNALPTLKRAADRASERPHDGAVMETMAAIVADDMRSVASPPRRALVLGYALAGDPVTIDPAGRDVLVMGAHDHTVRFIRGLLERIANAGYQYCVIDADGRFADVHGAVTLGNATNPPTVEELLNALTEQATASVVVNLAAGDPAGRMRTFEAMATKLNGLRRRLGRPHWCAVATPQHLCGKHAQEALALAAADRSSFLWMCTRPAELPAFILRSVSAVVGLGTEAAERFLELPHVFPQRPRLARETPPASAEDGLIWRDVADERVCPFRLKAGGPAGAAAGRPAATRKLGPEDAFRFRGPSGRLDLGAQDLASFAQLASGVDDDIFMHHLQRGDYSRWLRRALDEPALAAEIERIEAMPTDPVNCREQLKRAIETHLRHARPAER
jgi:hydroxymethylpyrimidine pyrophosphatase-like HAD family hydrolase